MRTQKFMKQLQLEAISVAIRAAELRTSGEIRVFVSRKRVDAPVTAAQAEFVRMGMSQTREKNAVLIFVAPAAQSFAVIGDTGVHAKCGDAFWLELADAMTKHFQKSEFTEGILQGVHKAGELLAKHFPRRSDDRNELSDQVEHD
ncbi:MAG: TPM domain-containing protein [Verrucomicrobiota bacterium]